MWDVRRGCSGAAGEGSASSGQCELRQVDATPSPNEPLLMSSDDFFVLQDKPTVLVVDDTPDNLTLISGLFMQDYRSRFASS